MSHLQPKLFPHKIGHLLDNVLLLILRNDLLGLDLLDHGTSQHVDLVFLESGRGVITAKRHFSTSTLVVPSALRSWGLTSIAC